MSVRVGVLGAFVLVACLSSWGLLGLYHLQGGVYGSPASLAIALGFMWGPAVGAFVAQRFIVGGDVPKGLGLVTSPNAWMLVAWLLPALLSLVVFVAGGLMPGVEITLDPMRLFERDLPQLSQLEPEHLEAVRKNAAEASGAAFFLNTLTGGIFFGLLRAFVALGEEVGWRGLALRHLAPLRFWKASVVIGLLWGLWYAPLAAFGHNYPDHRGLVGAGMMMLWTLLAAPLANFMRLRAKSVLGSALFLGGLHASATLPLRFSIGGDDLTRGLFGVPGLVLLAALNVVLVVRGVGEAEQELEVLAKS